MFNVMLDYPSYEKELTVVKNTTSQNHVELKKIISAEQILFFQSLVRKIPIADNVLEYAVSLASRTRPGTVRAEKIVNDYISWGAGPRASQFLVIGAKCNAAFNGKYSPDIEDVKSVAPAILRHRIIRNYKAEADGVGLEEIISSLLK
jgi:MoxR-like ATPase